MTYLGRRFGLSDVFGIGVSCGADGVFVGAIPLLEKVCGTEASRRPDQWEVRSVPDINRDLSVCYGVPVEFDRKIGGLLRIAEALSRGDLIHAQIATLHLQIPDPPALPGLVQDPGEMIQFARQLHASDLPSEILPPPVIPNISPRDLPRNPYPDRPECEQEWAEATDYCLSLKARNLLGRGDYRGSGRTLSQCIMGRVSQDCGGNSTGT
jgi:hypothetical protein